MITSHMDMPREGNLEAVLHAFAFLRQKYNSSILFDPTYPIINMNDFKECNWKDFYGYLNEAIPPNAQFDRRSCHLFGRQVEEYATREQGMGMGEHPSKACQVIGGKCGKVSG